MFNLTFKLGETIDIDITTDSTIDTTSKPTVAQIAEFAKQIPIALKQLETLPHELTPQTRKQLFDISGSLFSYGQLALGVSQIALMTGGHQRTWKGVASAAQSTFGSALLIGY